MDKKIIVIVIGAIIIGGGSFYAGIRYDQSKNSRFMRGAEGFANLSPEERQGQFQRVGMGGAGRTTRTNGSFTNGEILAKDENSITLKLREGGSKIIFLSDSTQILKTATGSAEDLAVGREITATGKANPDGSINAESIQVRPSQTITQ